MAKKLTSKRARNSEAKDARRSHILKVGFSLFQSHRIDEISMDLIAKKTKLAKGTLYLYFRTKDEVFLSLLGQEFAKWTQALQLDRSLPAKEFAAALVSSLQISPELPRLLSALHSVLEHNIRADTALEFKLALKKQLSSAADQLAGKTPALTEQTALSFLLKAYTTLVGLYPLAHPNPLIQKVLEHPGLEIFQFNFEQQLTDTLWLLLVGMEEAEAQKSKTFHLFKNY